MTDKPTFRDFLFSDIQQAFLNLKEFADLHVINGNRVPAIIDTSRFDDLPDVQALHNEPLSIYVAQGALKRLPRPNDPLDLDGYHYKVFAVSIEQGVHRIDVESVVNL